MPEYRDVDKIVAPRAQNRNTKRGNIPPDSDFDEDFMHKARQQRHHKVPSEATKKNQPLYSPGTMSSVEIPFSSNGRKERTPEKKAERDQGRAAATRRDSSAHESPDELQGETTISKPNSRSPRSAIVPRSDTSPEGRRNVPSSQIPHGKFIGTQKETRSKSSKKGSQPNGHEAEQEYNLKLARFQNHCYDETTHPGGGVLTIGDSDILIWPKNRERDSEKRVVAIQNIQRLMFGSDASAKVRLMLRKSANTRENSSHFDLEFTSEKEKSDFSIALQNHGKATAIKVQGRNRYVHLSNVPFLLF